MKGKYRNKFRRTVFIFSVSFILVFTAGFLQVQDEKTQKVQTDLKQTEDIKTGEPEEVSIPADTVKIGAYIISIYDLNFPENRVNVDFYLWYNTYKDSMDLIENFEIINSIAYNKSHDTREERENQYYINFRVVSEIKKEWDISSFPFDKQVIEIDIEDYNKDLSMMVFVPDTAASMIDKNVKIEGWQIKGFEVKTREHVYETNYGDPDIPQGEYSSYSRATIYIYIEREGNGLFFKLFLGLFISVLISLITFFIDPMDLDPRFGLSVGAIFAAIASQYVITSTLPQNERLTLVDILHDVSFIFIFLCIIGSVISLNLKKKGMIKQQRKLDKTAFITLSIMYVILVLFFVLKSI